MYSYVLVCMFEEIVVKSNRNFIGNFFAWLLEMNRNSIVYHQSDANMQAFNLEIARLSCISSNQTNRWKINVYLQCVILLMHTFAWNKKFNLGMGTIEVANIFEY